MYVCMYVCMYLFMYDDIMKIMIDRLREDLKLIIRIELYSLCHTVKYLNIYYLSIYLSIYLFSVPKGK